MKNLFKPETVKMFIAALLLLLMVKLLWFAVEVLWLPSYGVDHRDEKRGKALYYRVKLTPNEMPVPAKLKPSRSVGSHGNIKDIILLAIYNASDTTVITVSYKNKTKVLSRGDEINGYVLEGAGRNFATFSKQSRTFRINLVKSREGKGEKYPISSRTHLQKEKSSSAKPEGEIVDAGDHKIVDKSLVEYYAKNMKDIGKDIGVTEEKNGKELKGFRVTFIRKNSLFSKLGLKRGDVIKAVNGQELTSYNAAMDFYKSIDSIDSLSLTIKRGKEEMELEYEIN